MQSSLVRVLVVDDSAIIRAIMRGALQQHPQIEVVGAARDGVEAITLISRLRPDVVTLDVEMPRLNGIGVLERVAGKVPVSFVMVSTLTQAGAQVTFECLQKGAFDYVTKPQPGQPEALTKFRTRVQQLVLAAAKAKGRTRKASAGTCSAAPQLPPNKARGWVVAVGISCGGPQTLHRMLPAFPSDFVPIVVTQHMPAGFTAAFANHLNSACAMNVREATDCERLEQGTILIAPGGKQLRVARRGADVVTQVDAGPEVSGHRPSVDALFESVARTCGKRAIGVIMTGMGRDGAAGIVKLHEAGAHTIGQDEATSLVYGMPKVAAETGCLDRVAALDDIQRGVAAVMGEGVRSAS